MQRRAITWGLILGNLLIFAAVAALVCWLANPYAAAIIAAIVLNVGLTGTRDMVRGLPAAVDGPAPWADTIGVFLGSLIAGTVLYGPISYMVGFWKGLRVEAGRKG